MSIRPLLAALAVVLACAPQDPSPATAPAQPDDVAPPAAATAPTAAAAAEPADDATWQMTTLVAQGPATMIGKHGHYELRFADDGASVTVHRVGQDGKALPSEATMTGTAKLRRAFTAPSSAEERDVEFTVELANERGRQSLTAHAWISGEQMIGRWYHTPARGGAPEGEIVGVLAGRKGVGSSFVELASVQELPCPICCDAVVNCGGMGPRACNSSNLCLEACTPVSLGSDDGPPSGKRMIDLPNGCVAPL
jgi:pyruvate/2-oxoglutarate dehydrogenase complex dihydrolipoamide acyltransferase (E2) component